MLTTKDWIAAAAALSILGAGIGGWIFYGPKPPSLYAHKCFQIGGVIDLMGDCSARH